MAKKNYQYNAMSYAELLRASDTVKSGKEARFVHSELRKYGDGLPFWKRHPFLAKIVIIIVDACASVALVRLVLGFCGK